MTTLDPGNAPLTAKVPPGGVHHGEEGSEWFFWLVFASLALFPRICVIGFWIFSRDIGDAFSSWVIPAAGLVLAPATTLAYGLMWGTSSNTPTGAEWIVVGIGVVIDLLAWGSLQRALRRG